MQGIPGNLVAAQILLDSASCYFFEFEGTRPLLRNTVSACACPFPVCMERGITPQTLMSGTERVTVCVPDAWYFLIGC